ncbi:MAG: small, acid-soluble spore protein, alpha/beta type [Eubacteriales bacterium]
MGMDNNDNSNKVNRDKEVLNYESVDNIAIAGRVGGEMVRRMIRAQEEKMITEKNYLDKLR